MRNCSAGKKGSDKNCVACKVTEIFYCREYKALFSTARHSLSVRLSGYSMVFECEELNRADKNGIVGIDLTFCLTDDAAGGIVALGKTSRKAIVVVEGVREMLCKMCIKCEKFHFNRVF